MYLWEKTSKHIPIAYLTLISDSAVTCTFNGQHLTHPTDCHKFYQCVGSTPNEITCANGLAWNDEISNCDHPENVALCNEAGDNGGDAEDDNNESEVTGSYFIPDVTF